jgi:hypothetical protein
MAENASFAYLQARLQARHGDRPSSHEWRIAEASAELSHFLDALRRTTLKRWVAEVNHEMSEAAIERQFRQSWRETVDQVAGWAPEQWRPAVEWLRWLPDLPALEHLVQGGKIAPWMRDDPIMRDFAFDDPNRRHDALEHHPLGVLASPDHPQVPGQTQVGALWVKAFMSLLPGTESSEQGEVDRLVSIVRDHLETMRGSADADGRTLRNQLLEKLTRQFRRGAGTATALFSHLAIDGLELERVRAGVITRHLMPQRAEGRSWA